MSACGKLVLCDMLMGQSRNKTVIERETIAIRCSELTLLRRHSLGPSSMSCSILDANLGVAGDFFTLCCLAT